jgi:Domain of unknown function (DUF4270)
MNRFSLIKKSLLAVIGLFLISSCDKDLNEVGADIIGDDNFLFENISYPVNALNQFDAAVQTNNLPLNQLGVSEDAFFGKTTSSFVTQVSLATINPSIPAGTIVVDRVELSVPYFNTLVTSVPDGDSIYKLDSVYGAGKINLKIYESTKFLKSTVDQNNFEPQLYFSDEFSVFDQFRGNDILNDDPLTSQNTEFQFSKLQQEESVLTAENIYGTAAKVAPRMKLNLKKSFFENKLFGATATGKLANNAIFQQYFNGLFFKVEQVGAEKAMMNLNFAAGKINVFYKTTTEPKLYLLTLNLVGNTVNLHQNQYNASLPTSNTPTLAEEKLYLKGGSGFHTYIDLFGGNVSADGTLSDTPEMLELKSKNWLINEANLVFTVDDAFDAAVKNAASLLYAPKRIYLYNTKSKKPILDFLIDGSGSSTKPKFAKSVYGGIISENANGATKYKIRITNHLRNIIKNDSLNVRLGLVVTENIGNVLNRVIKNTPENVHYNKIPEASVINPLGTILWGSSTNVPEEKRVKLEIFYTKPN